MITVLVSPANLFQVSPGQVVQFVAQVTGASNSTVSWQASLGVISQSGQYTAPADADASIYPGGATITARSIEDTARTGLGLVSFVTGQPGQVVGAIAAWNPGNAQQVANGPQNFWVLTQGDAGVLAQQVVAQQNNTPIVAPTTTQGNTIGGALTTAGAVSLSQATIHPDGTIVAVPLAVTPTQATGYTPPPQVNAGTTNGVSWSDDGSLATTFTFPAPVFLQEGTEYCIVVMANSDKYRLFTARMGEPLLNGSGIVSKQPYNGVMFMSQNASTWSAIQDEDLKFILYRARFNTSAVGQVIFSNIEVPDKLLSPMPFQTQQGSGLVRVFHKNHDLPVGQTHVSRINITIPDGRMDEIWNGIPASAFHGEHDVANVDLDSLTIQITGQTATSSGRIGPSDAYASRNVHYDVLHPIFGTVVPPQTTADWSLRGITGKSPHNNPDATQEPYTKDSQWTSFLVNQDVVFTAPKLIANSANETELVAGADGFNRKSLLMQAIIQSAADNVSPVIDSLRSAFIAVGNRLDDPSVGNFTIDGMDDEVTVTSGSGNTVDFVSVDGVNQIVQSGDGGLDFSVFRVGKYVKIAGSSANVRAFGNPARIIAVEPNILTLDTSPDFVGAPNLNSVTITQMSRYVREEASEGCTTASRYISRRFDIKDPANSLHLYLTVNRPPGSFIDVYYRVLWADTNDVFALQPYVPMVLDSSVDNTSSKNSTEFKEYVYTADNIGKFVAFSIKIVMRGGNSAQVPRMRDLRGIALAI